MPSTWEPSTSSSSRTSASSATTPTGWVIATDSSPACPEHRSNASCRSGAAAPGAATAYALLSCGAARLDLYDVDAARAEDLAERMRVSLPDADRRDGRRPMTFPRRSRARPGSCTRPRSECSIIRGSRSTSACSSEGAWVSDVVYRPLETELIRQAAERGHPVLDGGRMAVGQAYASLQIITG